MKQIINGRPVPYNLTKEKLFELLSSKNMSDFTLACEALSYFDTEEACDKLGNYFFCKDKYRRLCVLKVIFRNPYAAKYTQELEKAICSDDILFVDNGLLVANDFNINISENIIIAAVNKHFDHLKNSLRALDLLSEGEKNYNTLINFFSRCDTSLKQEIVADILCDKYISTKANELFEVFSVSANPKIRKRSVEIGKENGFDVTMFENDVNGHVRYATKASHKGKA